MRIRLIDAHIYIAAILAILAAFWFAATRAQALVAPHPFVTHHFTGQVLEIREVVILANTRAQVALVQTDFYRAWVILRVEPGRLARNVIMLGEAQPGDQVQVFITAPHVFPEQVNWSFCQPAASDYCQFGAAYEAAPLSLDWNIPLSLSNEFIHYGHAGPHYSNALYWFTSVSAPSNRFYSEDGRGDPVPGTARILQLADAPHRRWFAR